MNGKISGRLNTIKAFLAVIAAAGILFSSVSVCAAPQTMPDGQVFDPAFYAATYPDVAAAMGTDPAMLYQHYVQFGKAEGRLPYAVDSEALKAQQAAAQQQALLQQRQAAIQAAVKNGARTHSYSRGLTAQQAAQADAVAQQIANAILANPAYSTDLQRVNAATQAVAGFCARSAYGNDPNRYYRTPYGVFVAGVYTCAGSTRALGRVLDYMGYTWTHTNENQWSHQWCVLTMDGQTGFADGMGGFAGYGAMHSGMTIPGVGVIYFAE
ncbi:MAG: hypothetical protein IJI62_01495 [Lachnospiraceae bacterium]|nr:hypothetical protein [Lachnospiraceae bacterium]